MYQLLIQELIDPSADTTHRSKRYSRLMKEHGINHNGSLTGNGGQATAPKNTQATGKKRKLTDRTETLDETDDGSDADQVKNKSSKKSRKTSALAAVKDEEGLGMSAAGINDGWVSEEFLAGFLPGPEDTSDGIIKTEEHDDEA